MYTLGFKRFQKPLWVIDLKFYDIVTDMFINTESEVSRSFAKMVFLTRTRQSFIKKVAGY